MLHVFCLVLTLGPIRPNLFSCGLDDHIIHDWSSATVWDGVIFRPRGLVDAFFSLWRVDDLRPCRRRLACLEFLRDLKALFPPQMSAADVRTSFWKECCLGAFVRSTVRRDLDHNLPD